MVHIATETIQGNGRPEYLQRGNQPQAVPEDQDLNILSSGQLCYLLINQSVTRGGSIYLGNLINAAKHLVRVRSGTGLIHLN